ncbi:YdaE family protein [Kosakonia cowanii]|uniref:YdaE family protein n=1 Tax=Kosakonia cowanii TaxID=208223 RepID=UPI003EECDE42
MCNSTKCGYCGKPVKPEDVVKSALLYRNGAQLARSWRAAGAQLARKEKEYCSERCASYDKMAHEA